MFQVNTKFPVAIDSDDHKYPEGVFYDNRVNLTFIESVEHFFGKKINFMDQGCAGGALVLEMNRRGHFAVGLEGSDQIYNPSEELLKESQRKLKGKIEIIYNNHSRRITLNCLFPNRNA